MICSSGMTLRTRNEDRYAPTRSSSQPRMITRLLHPLFLRQGASPRPQPPTLSRVVRLCCSTPPVITGAPADSPVVSFANVRCQLPARAPSLSLLDTQTLCVCQEPAAAQLSAAQPVAAAVIAARMQEQQQTTVDSKRKRE